MFCTCKKSKIGEVLPLLLCYTVPWTEDQLKAKAPWHEGTLWFSDYCARRVMHVADFKHVHL